MSSSRSSSQFRSRSRSRSRWRNPPPLPQSSSSPRKRRASPLPSLYSPRQSRRRRSSSSDHVNPNTYTRAGTNTNPNTIDRATTTPFLLNFCYRSSAFHNLSDFPIPYSTSSSSSRNVLPAHLQIYTWSSCTLKELAHLLTATLPGALPDPVVGTRLSFRLVYPDTTAAATATTPSASSYSHAQPGENTGSRNGAGNRDGGRLIDESRARYISREIGSVVVTPSKSSSSRPLSARKDRGASGEGREDGSNEHGDENGEEDTGKGKVLGFRLDGEDAEKTLADARFVIGHFIDCAIFPPLSDGSVMPRPNVNASGNANYNSNGSANYHKNNIGGSGGTARGGGYGHSQNYSYGYGRSRNQSFNSSSRGMGGGGGGGGGVGGIANIPNGEWRRGERLPDSGGFRNGGGGGGRGRRLPY